MRLFKHPLTRYLLEPTAEEGQLVVEIDRQRHRLEQFGNTYCFRVLGKHA